NGACTVPNVCVNGTCLYCGLAGGPCCPPGAPSPCFTPSDICCNGFCTLPGHCPVTSTTTSTTTTLPCGDSGLPCCAGGACTVPFMCVNGTCIACGPVGGSCCPPGADRPCFDLEDRCCGGACLPPNLCPPTTTTSTTTTTTTLPSGPPPGSALKF